MSRAEDAARIARALKRLCDEHGAENGFTAREIGDEAALSDLRVGHALRHPEFLPALGALGIEAQVERRHGHTFVDTRPTS